MDAYERVGRIWEGMNKYERRYMRARVDHELQQETLQGLTLSEKELAVISSELAIKAVEARTILPARVVREKVETYLASTSMKRSIS